MGSEVKKPAQPYDFRASFVVVNITTIDGGESATFSAVKTPGISEHLPYFSRAQIEENISTHGNVEIALTPPTYQEAIELLNSKWLTIGNTIGVRWGYTSHASHSSPWHYGMLVQPDITFGDEFGISIKAVSFGWVPTRITGKNAWNLGEIQPGTKPIETGGMSRLDVILAIAKRYNFEVNINDGSKEDDYGLSEDALNELVLNKRATIMQTANDFVFMKHLAIQSSCRFFITRGNRINVMDKSQARDQTATFVYRGPFDLMKNEFPIESFDSETTAMFLPTSGVATHFLSPYAKGSDLSKKWNANELTSPTQAISGPQVQKDGVEGTIRRGPDGENIPRMRKPDETDGSPQYIPVILRGKPGEKGNKVLERQLESVKGSIFRQKADDQGVSATVVGPALPGLLPEDVVGVRGVGRYHSVAYRTHKIVTTVGESFASHQVTLAPKGFSGAMAAELAEKAPKPPSKDSSVGVGQFSSSGRDRGGPL